MENPEKEKNNNHEEQNMNYINQFTSVIDWWQQNSPMAWVELYNEYIRYVTSMTKIYKEYIERSEKMTELYKELAVNTEKMTELYKESVESTERMTNHWLNKFPNPLSPKEKRRREKQANKLKNKK